MAIAPLSIEAKLVLEKIHNAISSQQTIKER